MREGGGFYSFFTVCWERKMRVFFLFLLILLMFCGCFSSQEAMICEKINSMEETRLLFDRLITMQRHATSFTEKIKRTLCFLDINQKCALLGHNLFVMGSASFSRWKLDVGGAAALDARRF